MNCKIIRSNRKSLGLEVNTEGLIIRAPLQATDAEINMVIFQHKNWIEKHLNKIEEQQKNADSVEPLSMDEIRALADQALRKSEILRSEGWCHLWPDYHTEPEVQVGELQRQRQSQFQLPTDAYTSGGVG